MGQDEYKKIVKIDTDLKTHEVKCDERWKTTFNRLDELEDTLSRLESRILFASGSIILFLAGVIVASNY